MEPGGRGHQCPFRLRIEQWKAVGGGVSADGERVDKPPELVEAELIDNLCQRYGCLPSELLAEDASLLMRVVSIASMGRKDEAE